MKYIILTNMYPKEGNLYRNAFIHRRVLEYKKRGLEIEICVLDESLRKSNEYIFDDVKVFEGNGVYCEKYISEVKPTKILVHFINRRIIKVLQSFLTDIPVVVWIHLMEATAWYRRLFSISDKGFMKYIMQNTRQLFNLRSFIKESKNYNIEFIFVSNWVKRIAEKDMFIKINKFHVINNVIDTSLFKYQKKPDLLRKRILLIRPFESKKYANDVAVKAILELSKKSYFNDLEFSIYGSGKLFNETIKPILDFPNIKIYNRFLNHNEIKQEHGSHGLFLCPTRQDSQGVSMCEAMSSGLVPITTNITAIPEFVENMKTGILTNNPNEIVKAIELIYHDPSLFNRISVKAAKYIKEKCGPELVIEKEIEVIKN